MSPGSMRTRRIRPTFAGVRSCCRWQGAKPRSRPVREVLTVTAAPNPRIREGAHPLGATRRLTRRALQPGYPNRRISRRLANRLSTRLINRRRPRYQPPPPPVSAQRHRRLIRRPRVMHRPRPPVTSLPLGSHYPPQSGAGPVQEQSLPPPRVDRGLMDAGHDGSPSQFSGQALCRTVGCGPNASLAHSGRPNPSRR